MPSRQRGILEFPERELAQGNMHPEVIAACLESVSQGIARFLGIARSPEIDAFLVVELRFGHAPGVNQLEAFGKIFDFRQADCSRAES